MPCALQHVLFLHTSLGLSAQCGPFGSSYTIFHSLSDSYSKYIVQEVDTDVLALLYVTVQSSQLSKHTMYHYTATNIHTMLLPYHS